MIIHSRNYQESKTDTTMYYKIISLLCAILMIILIGCDKRKTWTLQTDDTKLVVGLDSDHGFCILELSDPASNWNWTDSPSRFQLMDSVNMDGVSYMMNWVFKSGVLDKDGTKLNMIFTNAEPDMELRSVWQAREGQGPIRHTMYLKNNTGSTIRIYEQESIFLQASCPENNTTVWYINDDGSSPDSIGVYTDPLEEGYHRSLRISEDAKDWIPFVVLDANSKYGCYIGWEWSIGRILISRENGNKGTLLKAGNGDDFRTDLFAGETFEVPPAFIGAYTGDIDDCGNSLRKYLFNYSMPDILREDNGFPKVEWNAFAATGKEQGSWDPVESKYYPLIDDIAPLGFEDIVIDVGWWSNVINKNPYTGEEPWTLYKDPFHYNSDPEDWPSGMPAAAAYAKNRGMTFGLYSWIKPEFLLSDSGKDRIISQLTYLCTDLKADFYRSDNIFIFSESTIQNAYGNNQRAHYPEDVGYWSTKGYYEVIDSLYKKIPDFYWENCSNGGRIKDYGTLKRAARIQNLDIYFPISARQSFYDASHALHPMQISAMTGSWSGWQATGSVYEFRSSSMGSSVWHPDAPNGGNGGPVWSAKQREEIKRAVSTYKERLRPLIRNGNLYHIFPRPDGIIWDGIEYFDPEVQKGVVYIFKPESDISTMTVKLKGLDPDLEYRLSFEDSTNAEVTLKGAELMKKGISVTLKGQFISELMFIDKK